MTPMTHLTLLQIEENDLRKLHSEVTQLVQQRFYLTTIAIVVFGTVCGWAPAQLSKNGVFTPQFATLLMVVVLVMLGLLFFYSMLLLGQMRVITVYIRLAFASKWEDDWHRFNHPGRKFAPGYSWASAYLFMALGGSAQAFISFFWWLSGGIGRHQCRNTGLQVAMLAAYECLVILLTAYRRKLFGGSRLEEQWKAVLHEVGASRDSDVGLQRES